MPAYIFSIRSRAAVEAETLGTMQLLDDAEAFAFAKQMVEDMADEDRAQGGYSVEITNSERAVGRISCNAS